jgi:hypothetical protein
MANDLYNLLLRKEAKLIMQIEVLDHTPNIAVRKETIEQKDLIQKRRLHMKARLKESV